MTCRGSWKPRMVGFSVQLQNYFRRTIWCVCCLKIQTHILSPQKPNCWLGKVKIKIWVQLRFIKVVMLVDVCLLLAARSGREWIAGHSASGQYCSCITDSQRTQRYCPRTSINHLLKRDVRERPGIHWGVPLCKLTVKAVRRSIIPGALRVKCPNVGSGCCAPRRWFTIFGKLNYGEKRLRRRFTTATKGNGGWGG